MGAKCSQPRRSKRLAGRIARTAVREGLREDRYTAVAERNPAAGVQHPGANPAGRGKYQRSQGLAHSAQLGPYRSAEPGHGAPSLRQTRPRGKRKMMRLSRFVPTARNRNRRPVRSDARFENVNCLPRAVPVRAFRRRSRNSAPRARLPGAFAEVLPRTRRRCRRCRS